MEHYQKRYYHASAAGYDAKHLHADDEHFRSLDVVDKTCRDLKVRTVLDVGCGTGRGVRYLLDKGYDACGVDPSEDLLDEARAKGIAPDRLVRSDGERLPYADGSFDAVTEFGVLHHVRHPERLVGEMLRVSRKAVFLSDSNRFGQGPMMMRRLKWALYRLGLWPLANLLKTRGKGYIITEGDGLSYSYSVYDSYRQVQRVCDKVVVLPTQEGVAMTEDALLKSSHALLIGIRTSSARI
ncbi:MAG: Ubiquinone/menaquinone biosynthesis C-methyltransferase UbiE [Candidatus Omnitrophica bacterium]|nr:Ubiquinone/menaquinone biosynthesis C-methyltransferase UbiE [Candidatus Omnitrophota bacterium]